MAISRSPSHGVKTHGARCGPFYSSGVVSRAASSRAGRVLGNVRRYGATDFQWMRTQRVRTLLRLRVSVKRHTERPRDQCQAAIVKSARRYAGGFFLSRRAVREALSCWERRGRMHRELRR